MQGNSITAPVEFVLTFDCAVKSTIGKLNVEKISKNTFSLMVTFYIRGSKFFVSQISLLKAKYFFLDRPS